MADKKLYGFNLRDTKRIGKVVRRVEGTPATYLRVPERIRQPVMNNNAGRGSGFPPGSSQCLCGIAARGITLPDGAECCESHLIWRFTDPLFRADDELGVPRRMKYLATETWITDPFDGPDCDLGSGPVRNQYRWQLHVDTTGAVLQIVVETDNGCPLTCLRYSVENWECQAANQLDRLPDWDNIPEGLWPYCRVCLEPESAFPRDLARCGNEAFIATVPAGGGDDYLVSGGYKLTDTSTLPYSFVETCAYLGDPVSGGYPAFLFTGYFSLDVLGYTGSFSQIFRVCDEPFGVWNGQVVCFGDLLEDIVVQPTNSTGEPYHGEGYYDHDDIDIVGTDAAPSDFVPGQPTSSGKCITCVADDAPAVTDDCCCFAEDLFAWGDTLCDAFGGTFYPDCAGADCNPAGSCCLPSDPPACVDDHQFRCTQIGGDFTEGASCDDDPCGIPTGACCPESGPCAVTTEADCSGLYDTWYGPGTDCSGRVCVGACCCDDTFCCVGLMTEDPCLMGSGTPGHPTSDCSGTLSWIAGDDCSHCPGSC